MKDELFKEYFSHTPDLPENLSKENMIKKLEESNIKPVRKVKKQFSVELAAAVFAVIIIAAVAIGFDRIDTKPQQAGDAVTSDNSGSSSSDIAVSPENITEAPKDMVAIENEAQLKEYFKEIKSGDFYYLKGETYVYFAPESSAEANTGSAPAQDDSDMSPTIAATDTLNSSVNRGDKGHTGTNTQNSVDEGDIIKNDGRYIYVAGKNMLTIEITDTESMENVSSISYNKDNYSVCLHEIYVSGDTLTVIYAESENKKDEAYRFYGYYNYYSSNETKADIYDISDRSKPKKLRTITQDGNFLTSRMLDGKLCMVTNYSKNLEEDEEYYLPEINGEEVPCTSVIHFEEKASVYTVVTMTDTKTENAKTESLSILTSSSDIYCSENNLYLLTRYYSSQNKTYIRKLALNSDKIICTASGEIDGAYDDKYSFDEYEGKLRAVTTSYDIKEYRNKCALYILDEELKQIGVVDDITKGLDEQVKAVRFMGEKAYVITFEQTDPLFIIDLSDEKAPKVAGELYMPGYSTYLHPLSDTVLMGIGYGGDDNGADMGKLKIALFDVSDMTKPAILDEYVIKNGSSDANYEPKALIHFPQKNIVGIPVTVYNSAVYSSGSVQSFAIITYADNKLSSVEGFTHDRESHSSYYGSFFRGTCIGDKLYTVDDYKIVEHSLETGEKERECAFFTAEELDKLSKNSGYAVVVTSVAVDQ